MMVLKRTGSHFGLFHVARKSSWFRTLPNEVGTKWRARVSHFPVLAVTLLALLASTPRIDEYVEACQGAPVDGFEVPKGLSAPASGEVKVAGGDRLELAHCFLENHEVRVVHTVVTGLESFAVKKGERVTKGQKLGTGRRAKVTIDERAPREFVLGREWLLSPRSEPVLVVVDVDEHVAVRFEQGRATHEWQVGHGQAEGVKEERGDLKTPRGLYFVVERSTGPFAGVYAGYFGKAWVKVNYPNAFDASRGLDAGLISATQADQISTRWARRALTPQGTKLGGGIGFHGWIEPWDGADGGFGLSWGCVVMHPEEMKGFYDVVPTGAPVVLR
jgi:hypothetical protein